MQSPPLLAGPAQVSTQALPCRQIGVCHFAHFTVRNRPALIQHNSKRQSTTEITQTLTQFNASKACQYNGERHGRTTQKPLHWVLLIDGDAEYLPPVR